MKKLLLSGVISLFAVSAVFAGESATSRALGFSKDGKYFAYVEFLTQDGSGFTEATVKFLDVKKNAFVEKAIAVRDESDTADVVKTREKAITKAIPTLTKLGIKRDNVDVLVSRQITDTDVSQNKDLRKVANFATYRNVLAGNTMSVKLDQKKAPKQGPCISETESQIVKVTLKKEDGKEVVLQEDKDLPSTRQCVFDYSIQDIFTKEDSKKEIVIIINATGDGFEGPSTRTMVVSGMLE